MGSLRKLIASVSLFALIFTITGVNTIAGAFTDVPANAFYADSVAWAAMEGIVDNDDEFNPDGALNRAELATMLVRALDLPMDTSAGPSFDDVPETGSLGWAYSYIETVAANGIMTGDTDADGLPTGTFRPGDNVQRAEVATVLVRAYGFDAMECSTRFSDVDYSQWYGPYMNTACYYGLMNQGRPSDNANRAEFVTMLDRAANYVPPSEEEEEEEEVEEEVELPTSTGTLMVAVASSTPDAGSIPADSASVNYTTLALSASGDDVAVNGLTVWRDGLGTHSDFSNVWISVDGFRVGSQRSINSDQNAVLNLSRDYIVVPEGETVLVDVRASMGTSVSSNRQNRLGLRSAADVDTNAASVAGLFPMYGNLMTTSSYTIGDIEFSVDGSASEVDVGEVQAVVGEFQLENQSDGNEDFVVSSVTLEVNGTGNFSNLANAKVYYLGEVVSDTVTPFDDSLRFTFSDGGFLLEDGDTEEFEVKADIVAGDDADTVILTLDEADDLTAFVADSDYNYAVNVLDADAGSFSSVNLRTYTINAGAITFARATTSPSSSDITNDINNVLFLVANVAVGEDIKVTGIRVYLDGTFTTGTDGSTAITSTQCTTEATLIAILDDKIDNVKIWDGSRFAAGGQTTLAADGTTSFASSTCTVSDAYYQFTDNFDLSAGAHTLQVTADVSQYMAANETVSLSFENVSSTLEAEYVLTGDDVATGDVNGTATGSTFTVESATLTLARQDGYSNNEDIVKGAQDMVLLQMKLQNNNAGAVSLKSFTVEDGGTETVDGTYLTGFGVYEVGSTTPLAPIQDLGSDESASFTGMNLTIPSGGFKLLEIRGTVSSSYSAANNLHIAVTGVTAKDVNNNDATISYPNCLLSCSANNALLSTTFDVNDTAEVNIVFASVASSDYTKLTTPTGTCSEASCARLLGALQFKALYDDVTLKRLVVSNDDGTDAVNQRFGSFFLVDAQTGLTVASASMSDAGSADGQIVFDAVSADIPQDQEYVFNILASINSVTQVSQSGTFVNLYVDTMSAATGGSIELVSESTGTNLEPSSVGETGVADASSRQQTFVVRKSMPVITYNNTGLQTEFGPAVSGQTLYKFTVTPTGGSVDWKRARFAVTPSSTDVTATNFYLYVAGQSTPLNASADAPSGGVLTVDLDNEQVVSAATTYELKGNITFATTASSVTILMSEDGATDVTTTDISSLSSAEFIWSDRSDTNHSASTSDWTDGLYVDSLGTTPIVHTFRP